jgi:hypothetical protein
MIIRSDFAKHLLALRLSTASQGSGQERVAIYGVALAK